MTFLEYIEELYDGKLTENQKLIVEAIDNAERDGKHFAVAFPRMNGRQMILDYYNKYRKMQGKNSAISEKIKAKAELMAQILLNGNSVEVKRNTDGTVKVYEVVKKKK